MIVTYHAIEKPSEETGNELYCVSLEKFKEQIEHIRETKDEGRGTRDDLRGTPYAVRITKDEGRCATITFDDGDNTNYTHAYPVLKEKGLKAYFFILVGKVEESGYMNWQQIKELQDAGMTIGSHGMSHRILTVLSEKEMDYELKDSKKILEQQLGNEVKYFSIPRGFCNKKVIVKAKEAGYQAVFTSNPSDNNGFLFGRIAIKANWNTDYFTRVINHGYPLKDRIEEWLKDFFKALLGTNNYERIRSNLLK
jgi:peptidoglycan/xylan/chitin deacetylase (PgdA/CDA1 family)